MNRFALTLALLLLPAAARPQGTAPADSGAPVPAVSGTPTPAVSKGSVMAVPGKGALPGERPRAKSRYAAPDSALVAALRGGGYLLVFRHGKTDRAERDADLVNVAERSTQRNLSEEGRRLMEGVGKAIAALRIPIGRVTASPLWRCRDTATLAFGHCDTTSTLFLRGPVFHDARVKLLGTPPEPGKNDALVTHQDLIMPILGLHEEELGEGEALVIRPRGGGKFDVLAQATPAQWDRLAAAAPAAGGTASQAR